MNIALRVAYRHAADRARKSSSQIRKMTSQNKMNPVEKSITEKLTDRFHPVHLSVINESYMHNVPKGSETHFKVVVVASEFKGLPPIKRHRLVNDTLKDELATGVHALSIEAKSPDQWDENTVIERSPPCRGGAGL